MPLEINSLFQERYRVTEKIQQSGMGTLYLARDEVLDIQVAIKENLYTTEEFSRQFHREATILGKLRHPNLPRIIDHFSLENSGEFLVMDYIPGNDLRDRLVHAKEPLKPEEAVLIGVTICDALIYLHSQNPPVIHRDIKPANIRITPDNSIILVDFGLAKFHKAGEVTTTGAQGVTPGYSPIEQYGSGTDARSDIYALGATLYTALTRTIPPEALERAMNTQSVAPIQTVNPQVSKDLDEVILKAMSLSAENRYPDAEYFKNALLQACPLAAYTSSKPVANGGQTLKPATGKKKLKTWHMLLIVLCLAAIVILATLLAKGRLSDTAPTTTAQTAAASTSTTGAATGTAAESTFATTQLAATIAGTSTATAAAGSTSTPTENNPQTTRQDQIVFVSERDGGTPQLWLMNRDGSEMQQLTSSVDGACQPDWSPDGNMLVYISPCSGRAARYDGTSVFVMDVESRISDLISSFGSGDYDPIWSPDGSKIAFTSLQTNKPQIFIYELATRKTSLLMNRSFINRSPIWSPDGSKIAFLAAHPTTAKTVVWQVNADGSGEPKVLVTSGWTDIYRPVWSPDNSMILFDLGVQSGIIGAMLDNTPLQISTSLSYPENVSFSPDGEYLLCDAIYNTNGRDIFIMLRTGARLERLTDDVVDDYQPAWRPSGE